MAVHAVPCPLRLCALASAILMAGTASPASQPSYPCWRGDGSGVGPDCGRPLVDDLGKARLVWESEERMMSSGYGIFEGNCGGPAVADGRVYAIWAFPAGEIDETFKKAFRSAFDKRSGKSDGLRRKYIKCFGISEDELFDIFCRKRMDDFVICIDAGTGRTLWKSRIEGVGVSPHHYYHFSYVKDVEKPRKKIWITMKPKQGPHVVPCVAYGKVAVYGYGGDIYCLNAADGEIVWRKPWFKPNSRGGATTTFSMTYGGGVFVAMIGHELVGLDPATGSESWRAKFGWAPVGRTGPIRGTFAGRDLIFAGGICFDPRNGAKLWQVPGHDPSVGAPAFGEGYLVLSGNGEKRDKRLVAYRLAGDPAQAPTQAWAMEGKYAVNGYCTPCIYRGHVYMKSKSDTGKAGEDVMMVCVELATGKIVGKAGFHSDACGSAIAGDGLVFYEKWAVFADPARFAFLSGNLAPPGDCVYEFSDSHTPVYVRGRLYIKGHNHIRCLDLRSGAPGRETAAPTAGPPRRPGPAAVPAGRRRKEASADAVAQWDAKLLALVRKTVAAGKRPTVALSSMRTTMTVKAVDSRGRLGLVKGGMRITFDFKRLSLEDRKSLAVAVADRASPGDCAVAAFYCLATGDETGSVRWTARAGEEAESVYVVFE